MLALPQVRTLKRPRQNLHDVSYLVCASGEELVWDIPHMPCSSVCSV